MDTWGISGPEFLLLYVALLAVTLAGVVLARRRVLAAPDGAAVPAHLDRYEAALLNGGCQLAATTAVSVLLREGHLASPARRGRRRRLAARTAPPAGAHPVEWAVYRLVADHPELPRWTLGGQLCQAPAMAAVVERLRQGGLALTREQKSRYRATGLWFLPLLAFGVARVVAGTANGRPVGFLIVLLVVTVVLAVALCLRVPCATELGRRTLAWLRAETGRPVAGASPSELAMATALFGAGVLWTADTEIAMALRIPREHAAFAGGSFAGDGGGGGSCGGGGGGGGVRRGVRRMSLLRGVGLGWRDELAGFVDRRPGLGFVEVVAERLHAGEPLPPGLERLGRRGVPVVPHGVRLSLGSAAEPDPGRVGHLAGLAQRLGSPLVSEHVAFVRGGGLEAGHLLPVPRTRDALDVLVHNVRLAQAELPVPLALEHVAALLEWPAPELDEAAFLTGLLERTGAWLLLDVANLHANARNHGGDPLALLDALPLERVAYVHVAGGVERDGLYHDTHAHPTPPRVLDLVAELCARSTGGPPGVMLERDDAYPPEPELAAELDAIAAAVRAGSTGRSGAAGAGSRTDPARP